MNGGPFASIQQGDLNGISERKNERQCGHSLSELKKICLQRADKSKFMFVTKGSFTCPYLCDYAKNRDGDQQKELRIIIFFRRFTLFPLLMFIPEFFLEFGKE